MHFSDEDQAKLKVIIDEQPQLYLDEIQDELKAQTGKLWDSSTIWRKIHKLGYSLKVAVIRAKQQNQLEVDAYFCRLVERVRHPCQLLYIDESARGALANEKKKSLFSKGCHSNCGCSNG